ncbi:MAG: hypothetical protein ACI4DK_15010 [Lachnospiraceae bacterium]
MGDVSIIARRLPEGYVQYGWSGNGGYFCNTGGRLLDWYQNPKDVEYLFKLGQTSLIGRVGSENGGYGWYETHRLTGEAFWLAKTERKIFSKIAFVDYGYFYDLDNRWYYIIPGPFRVKIPLEMIANNTDDRGYEFDYLNKIQARIARFIFNEYKETDSLFNNFLKEKGYDAEKILNEIIQNGNDALYELFDRYRAIHNYFDDWILIKANSDCTKIKDIIIHKKNDIHIETYLW